VQQTQVYWVSVLLHSSISQIRLTFYARKQLLLSARLSHCNSVCPSVTRVDQS